MRSVTGYVCEVCEQFEQDADNAKSHEEACLRRKAVRERITEARKNPGKDGWRISAVQEECPHSHTAPRDNGRGGTFYECEDCGHVPDDVDIDR